MFATNIDIRRKLAVINGFVEIPDGQRTARTALTPSQVLNLIPGAVRTRVGNSQIIDQEWIQLPDFDRSDGYPEDWYAILRAAAEA